jgi:hypothetical protein
VGRSSSTLESEGLLKEDTIREMNEEMMGEGMREMRSQETSSKMIEEEE